MEKDNSYSTGMKYKEINAYTKYLASGVTLSEACEHYDMSPNEIRAIIHYLNMKNKNFEFSEREDGEVEIIRRGSVRRQNDGQNLKPPRSQGEKVSACFISDTHLGSSKDRLDLLEDIYDLCVEKGITTVYHAGDLTDGNYINKRPNHVYESEFVGFDEQFDYVVDNYPYREGITTKVISGNHDNTHFINAGADIVRHVCLNRPDMEYLGQDQRYINLGSKGNLLIKLHHPGGGSAKGKTYKMQESINALESGVKPQALFRGHYHKIAGLTWRNVHAFDLGCVTDDSAFMERGDLLNQMGALFVDFYINKNGDIEYLTTENVYFTSSDKDIYSNHKVKSKKR